MTQKPYQICSRCVMDTSVADITFDLNGVCNYCSEFLAQSGHVLNKSPADRQRELDAFVATVKAAGQGKRYDCIVGVSGGVDSSWVLVLAVKLGLRPLAVHMDNGWNSELAQNNIANLVRTLGVDLHTHVIDWDEYRELMQAFFDADVIDVELLYDNAMFAVNYQLAARFGVKFILAGTNSSTEGMRMPTTWNWLKFDKRNIKALGRRFRGVRLKTFPSIGTTEFFVKEFIRRIRWIPFLDYFDYNKARALEVLQKDYGYKPYLFKHYESIFTRFYQGYILPRKFGVDKRRVHLGTLVASGQMTRDEALASLQGIPYASEAALADDIQYFLKKMGWSRAQLDEYMKRPERPHSDYPSERPFWNWMFTGGENRPLVYRILKGAYRWAYGRR
jgi:N-acetyl sugar amidotransferase